MKKFKWFRKVFPLFILAQMILTGCANYYKVIRTPLQSNAEKAAKMDSLLQVNRIFILRDGNTAFLMNGPEMNADQNKVECILDTITNLNKFHLAVENNRKMRYKKYKPAENTVLKEVHIYTAPGNNAALGKYSIPLSEINKIEVIEKDKDKTAGSYVLGGLGIIAAMGIAAMAIFIATYHPIE